MIKPLAFDELKLSPWWWEAAPRPPAGEAPALPERADVGIVGAGFTGLTAALTLARRGRDVVVFEAMSAGEGASTRNGGICSGNLRPSFSEIEAHAGRDAAMAIYGEGVAARLHLADFIHSEGIDCAFSMVGRFTGAAKPRHYDRLGREADVLRKNLGIEVEMVGRAEQQTEIGSDAYFGGQVRHDIGGLHPGLFHAGLAERARQAGARIVENTPVTRVAADGDGFLVVTERGRIRVGAAVVATNGYTDKAVPWLQRRIIPAQSQIVATEPLAPEVMARLMPKRRMYGETRNMYNYFRPSPDGERILFGGRSGATEGDTRRTGAHLYRRLVEIFPDLDGVRLTHSWSGLTGFTFDTMPHLCTDNGIHYAAGFCGSGVVWAPWLGRKVALRILGDNDSATVFADRTFPSMPLYRGRPWFLPLVIFWYALRDRLP